MPVAQQGPDLFTPTQTGAQLLSTVMTAVQLGANHLVSHYLGQAALPLGDLGYMGVWSL